jgi:hypothetical protein
MKARPNGLIVRERKLAEKDRGMRVWIPCRERSIEAAFDDEWLIDDNIRARRHLLATRMVLIGAAIFTA